MAYDITFHLLPGRIDDVRTKATNGESSQASILLVKIGVELKRIHCREKKKTLDLREGCGVSERICPRGTRCLPGMIAEPA